MKNFNLAFAFLGAVLSASCDSPDPPGARYGAFAEVGAESGIDTPTHSGSSSKLHIRESLGQGACWVDFDIDGDPDLFVLNGAIEVKPNYTESDPSLRNWRLYENESGHFAAITKPAGLDVNAWGVGCAVGDVNGDGFDDLYVTTAAGPNRLFVNTGNTDDDRRFFDSSETAGVDIEELSASAAFGDLDGDGDLDLFVTTYLDETQPPSGDCYWKGSPVMCGPKGYPMLADRVFSNDGNGKFTDVSHVAGIGELHGFGLGVVLLDADMDDDSDIYVANDSSPNRLLVNDGEGHFTDKGFLQGVAYSESGMSQAGMGVDAADLDGDGLFDLVVTNFSDDTNNLYRRHPQGGYVEWTSRSGLASASYKMLGWSVLAEDFDLDGDLDLFVANGHVYPEADAADSASRYRQRSQLLLNDGSGKFTTHPGLLENLEPANARGAAVADFDNDGDMDLVVTRDGETPWLLRNDLPAANMNWLGVRLDSGLTNPHGIGAHVILTAGGKRQIREIRANRGYLSASEPLAIFGLGETALVESLEIRWPDGEITVTDAPEINRTHSVQRRRP